MKKIFVLIAIATIISLIIFLNYDNFLKFRYKIAIKNKDCEKIYKLSYIEKNKYLEKEKFVEQCKLKLNNYKSKKIEIINHKIKNNLVTIYNNITFYVPSDSEFYLDDKLISDKHDVDSNHIYNIYKFNKMFEGKYKIKFKNNIKAEDNIIDISQDNIEKTYEYNNSKIIVTIINEDYCYHCDDLLNFLSTLDNNLFNIKIYNYDTDKELVNKKINDISKHFNTEVVGFPISIIGNKFIVGFNEDLEKKYIEAIYYSYRNQIETTIK